MIKKVLITSALVSSSFLLSVETYANNPSYSQIYVFGDSLSDTGNLYNNLGQQFPPSPPYFDGRFSNGLLWVENLAFELNLTPNQATNFAFAAAGTGISSQFVNANPPISLTVPGLLGQVNNYVTPLINTGQNTDSDALYILWAGALDYLFGNITPSESTTNIAQAITSLTNIGAKNLLIGNLPDLGLLPSTINTPNSSILTTLTNLHNQALETSINNLQLTLGNTVNLTLLDIDLLFDNLIANPTNFGLTNVTQGCLLIGCNNPDEFFFWDTIHPTAKTHSLISDFALETLNNAQPEATPEPNNLVGLLSLAVFALTFSNKSKNK
jgi:phospholipase/lecithinase/hemolysin